MTDAILDVTTVRRAKRTLAYIRHVGPYAGDSGLFERLFSQVVSSLEGRNLLRSDMEAITVYHDDPESVPVEKQRISVGFTVPEGTTANDGLRILELPESDYVVGSFELLPHQYAEAWTNVFTYMAENGLGPSGGPMYESYKNNPKDHPGGKHLVDICVAVKSRVGS